MNEAREPGPDEPGPSPALGEPSFLVPVADHQLLRRIGRGSYGEVWLARNTLGMYRAVKIVHRKSFKDQRPYERELSGIRKFEPISRSHEGFVDVLHVGINEELGCFYYVMELGDDLDSEQSIDPENYSPRTLRKEIARRGNLSLEQCLQLGLALSDALAQLHRHSLVHRDIKPSNIIFINGVPKLADIGLVAEANGARSYVGTEGYIPPEGPGTAQADIYGLGKVLYEASTGKDRQSFPELPLRWSQSAKHAGFLELNEVLLEACANEPGRRYASAWDMHADLLVVARGKSVKRLRMLERRWANLKRVAGVCVLAVAVLAAVSYEVYRDWNDVVQSRQRQVGVNIGYGSRAMDSGDLLGSLSYFAEALYLDKGSAEREQQHRLRLGSALAQSAKLVQMWFGPRQAQDVCFSPDGKRLLITEWFGRAQVFDVQTGRPVTPQFGQADGLCQGSYSPDGRLVLTASEDRTACIWKASDGTRVATLPHPDRVVSALFSPDGRHIITASNDKLARVWNAATGAPELKLEGHTEDVMFATFSPDGRRIATASRDRTARIWDATDGHQTVPPLHHPTWVGYAAFSPDGQSLVTACFDNKARVWDTATGKRIPPDLTHGDGVNSAEFSPDGRLIVTAGLDGEARIWMADNHQPLDPNPILRHSDRVTHAAFAPDGHRIATSCIDGTVRVWDLARKTATPSGPCSWLSQDRTRFMTLDEDGLHVRDTVSKRTVSPLLRPGRPPHDAKLSPDGAFVLAISAAAQGPNRLGRSVEVLRTATGERVGPPIVVTNELSNLFLSNDGKRLLAASGTGVQIWDVAAGKPLADRVLAQGNIESAVFSPDGSAVAAWGGSVVRVWDTSTGRETCGPLNHPFPVTCADFSPDGAWLVTCGADANFTRCYARLWNAATGKPRGDPLKHSDGVLWAAFSPDGRRVATAGEDFTARVWDAITGRQLSPNLKHEHDVRSAVFSPNAQSVLTASSDRTARVWSVETGDPLTPWLRHLQRLTGGRFLPDGRRIVTSDQKGQAWLWEVTPDERPVEDLRALARLLSGDALVVSGPSATPQTDHLKALWERLRAKYLSDFTASSEEIAAWHELEAAKSELAQQWFAVVFHLERLLALRPGDNPLSERLARANGHLQKGD
jgi:WD40 repeat protein/serine/threonine protein kinase